MNEDEPQEVNWLKSSEIRKKLKISTCELAHLREAGKLPFRKQGNAYLYFDDEKAMKRLAKKKTENR